MPAGISKVEQNRFLKAAAAGAESVVECMLARNCEVTVEDENGYTPLMLASSNGQLEKPRDERQRATTVAFVCSALGP